MKKHNTCLKGAKKMCRETETARNFGFYLFGGDLDFPESYTLSIPSKLLNYFDDLEIDDEDIENILWEMGDAVITAKDKFAVHFEKSKDLLLFNIDLNQICDGFHISLFSCLKTEKINFKRNDFPVLSIY
jgi:hypothetical protein